MRILKKFLLGLLGILAVFVGGVVITALSCHDRTFEAPDSDLRASTDPEIIERGRYLVVGPAHCTGCHGDQSREAEIFQGKEVPLIGGFVIDIPPGKFHVPNITPCPDTGIGRRTDAELVRIMRYGVRHDGQAPMPFMPFNDLSDDDLVAIISYLRAQSPARHEVPEHELTFLGKLVKALVIEPVGPTRTPPKSVEMGPTPEYGQYLAHHVANCYGCHTDRDLRTGEFTGEPFAGGLAMEALGDPTQEVVAQNITTGGKLGSMSEDVFVTRMRAGPSAPGTHMPWASFANMTDDDLRAIYRYLEPVPPSDRDPGPPSRPKQG